MTTIRRLVTNAAPLAATLALACDGGVSFDTDAGAVCQDSLGRLTRPVDWSKLKAESTGPNYGSGAKKEQPSRRRTVVPPRSNPRRTSAPAPKCGDGFCTAGEYEWSCPKDCLPNCGNGVIDPGEQCEGSSVPCTKFGYTQGSVNCVLCKYAGPLMVGDPWAGCSTKAKQGDLTCHYTNTMEAILGGLKKKYSCSCCEAGGGCWNGSYVAMVGGYQGKCEKKSW